MERREAPGAIDGRPFGGPLSGARRTPLTEACAPRDGEGLRLPALHRDLNGHVCPPRPPGRIVGGPPLAPLGMPPEGAPR